MRCLMIATAAALLAAPAAAQETPRRSAVQPDDFAARGAMAEADPRAASLIARVEAARGQTAQAMSQVRAGEEDGIVIFGPVSGFGFELSRIADDAAALSRAARETDPRRAETLAMASQALTAAANTRPLGPDREARRVWLNQVDTALDQVLILRKRPSR